MTLIQQQRTRARLEQALADRITEHYLLTLFVSGASASSAHAIANVRQMCDTHLSGRHELNVVDLNQEPAAAARHHVLATPTLVKDHPLPVRVLVGDMSNHRGVSGRARCPRGGCIFCWARRDHGGADRLVTATRASANRATVDREDATAGPASLGDVQARLTEAEETLRAIRNGEIDALVVRDGSPRAQVFTLSSADRPYRMFVENMRDGRRDRGGLGVVLYANRRLAELLGRPLQQVMGSPVTAFIAEDEWAALRAISERGGVGGDNRHRPAWGCWSVGARADQRIES